MSAPLSPNQIIESGYTQGDRFVFISNNLPYSGFYHKDVYNRYWTEQNHTLTSRELKDIFPSLKFDLNYNAKNNLVNEDFTKRYGELGEVPLFTPDYIGSSTTSTDDIISRYIIQLRASLKPENNIVEINEDNYNKLINNVDIANAYNSVIIPWKISSPVDDYINEYGVRVIGALSHNQRSIQQAEKTIKGISLYLNDPLQFVNASIKA